MEVVHRLPVTVYFLSDALGILLATFNNTPGAAAVQGNQVYGPYGNSLYSSGSMDTLLICHILCIVIK